MSGAATMRTFAIKVSSSGGKAAATVQSPEPRGTRSSTSSSAAGVKWRALRSAAAAAEEGTASRFRFSPRVPPYEQEHDHFFVATKSDPESSRFTRQATVEALVEWHKVLGSSASLREAPEDLDASLVQVSHQTVEPDAVGPRCRIVRHLFIPDETPVELPDLELDFYRFVALHPNLSLFVFQFDFLFFFAFSQLIFL